MKKITILLFPAIIIVIFYIYNAFANENAHDVVAESTSLNQINNGHETSVGDHQTTDALKQVVKKSYVCPMHSHILSDKEGNCPICGMDLVVNQSMAEEQDETIATESQNHNHNDDAGMEIIHSMEHSAMGAVNLTKSDEIMVMDKNSQPKPMRDMHNHQVHGPESTNVANDYPKVKLSQAVQNNLSVKTTHVVRGNLKHKIETIGKITRVDPMARTRITSPISGTIFEMVDKYGGDRVSQDEFLFSVVSEELFSLEKAMQDSFLAGDKTTASGLIPKLVEMGLDASQIAMLQNGETPQLPARFYAHEDGYVFTRRGQPGDPVTSSFTVFNLGGDYQVIEVTVEIFERQWDLVKEGQKATMQLRNLPGRLFKGTVDRVDEPVGYTTRALESRLKFKTDYEGLTQSTFARVFIDAREKQDVLIVPRDAVIRTAEGDRVIKMTSDNQFQPVEVMTGEEGEGYLEIISGLEEGDRIVMSGQFLIDSESNLLAGLRRLSSSNLDETNTVQTSHTHMH